jgi:hypothetical protein
MNCIICGEDINCKYSLSLDCNCKSKYHYECIQNTFKHDDNNKCPYCAKPYLKLPLVNGIKKIDPSIHIIDENNTFENIQCQTILKSGKNKGNKCGKNCKLGYETCQRHFINYN